MISRTTLTAPALTVLLALLGAAGSYAQNAQLSGRITDASEAVVPEVEVTVTNEATGVVLRSRSNDAGVYVVLQLIPGTYTVAARKDGFRPVSRSGVRLEVQQNARLDFKLEIGTVSESISVVQSAPLLEASTATLGTVMENRMIIDLPGMRNPVSVAALVPGAIPGAAPTPTIGGGRNSENDVLIDGGSYMVPENIPGTNRIVYPPSSEFVEEVKVEMNSLSAQYGRVGGGVISIATKAGTNEFHGAAFYFARHNKLDANNFFSNRAGRALGDYTQAQWGASAGGAIRRNKTFYFAGVQRATASTQNVLNTTVPLDPWRTGDFSALRLANGTPVTIYDPLTGRVDPVNAALFTRTAFPNNKIPESRINPVARNIMKYYPAANTTATNQYTGANNFFSDKPQISESHNFQTRLDHNPSDRWRIYGRYSGQWNAVTPPNHWENDGFSGAGPTDQYPWSLSLNQTITLSPSLIATVNYSFARFNDFRHQLAAGFDQTTLGFPRAVQEQMLRETEAGFPIINMGGAAANFSTNATVWLVGMTHNPNWSLTKIAGNHSLRFGGEYRKMFMAVWQTNGYGSYTFGREWTQREINTAQAAEGFPIASFLLGLGSAGTMNHSLRPASASSYWAGYFQDDWKITPKLTLNLGLRYELETPRTERYDRASYWRPDVPSPIAGKVAASACPQCGNLLGGMFFTDAGHRQQTPADKNNFAPRFGFAYQLQKETVLRGGYATMYSPSVMSAGGTNSNGRQGFTSSTSSPFSLDGRRTVYTTLSNPFADGFNLPAGRSLGTATELGFSITDSFFDEYVNGLVHQWNLNLQRGLPGGIVVEAGYLGSRGLRLLDGDGGRPYNQLTPDSMQLGSRLTQLVANPFASVITNQTSSLSRPTVAYNQLLRPYPQYVGVSSTIKPNANSAYHAFTLRVEKKFRNGLSFLSALTAGKLMDDASVALNTYGPAAGSRLDQYNRRLEWSVSSLDVSKRWVTSYVYELPFGRGKAWGSGVRGPLDWVVSGWQTAGILTFQTGTPVFLTGVPNNTNIFSGQRANNNGQSAHLTGGTTDSRLLKWFDTTVFSVPAPFTFGNVGRTLPDVRHPGQANTSLSFFKEFVTRERVRSQFRAELFNALNTPQWAGADAGIQNANFGGISATSSAARQIQLAIRVAW